MTDIKNVNFPKGTPPWSLGLTILLVSSITVFSTLYLAMRPEIQTYLNTQNKHLNIIAKEQKIYRDNTDKKIGIILGFIDNNDKQIIELSKMLGQSERERRDLEIRVHNLERDLGNCKEDLKKHFKGD